MITKIINDLSNFLPLSMDSIEWSDPTLILIGKNWSFSTVSSWRIIKNNKLIAGCYDEDALKIIKELSKSKVVSVEIQSNHISIDPVFIFSNGYKLEIFSTTFLEPWTFDFSSGTVYVASPSST